MDNTNFANLALFLGLGICPLVAGLLFFWASGQSSVVTCTRLETTHIDCRIERAFLGLIPTDQFTISRVTGTELATTCEDNSCTYAVDLLANDDAVQMTNMATSDLESVQAEKERIDEFLANTEATSLEFSGGPTWIGMLVTIPFIALGSFVTIKGVRTFRAKKVVT